VCEYVCAATDMIPDMEKGAIGSMRQLGVTESYKLKRQVVSSASEAAEMIIRYVDAIDFPGSIGLIIDYSGWIRSCVRRHGNEKLTRLLSV
jgi:hypothetical protein